MRHGQQAMVTDLGTHPCATSNSCGYCLGRKDVRRTVHALRHNAQPLAIIQTLWSWLRRCSTSTPVPCLLLLLPRISILRTSLQVPKGQLASTHTQGIDTTQGAVRVCQRQSPPRLVAPGQAASVACTPSRVFYLVRAYLRMLSYHVCDPRCIGLRACVRVWVFVAISSI